jgi:hypothetical protein
MQGVPHGLEQAGAPGKPPGAPRARRARGDARPDKSKGLRRLRDLASALGDTAAEAEGVGPRSQ